MLTSTDPSTQRLRLHELEKQASTEGFWENQDKAASVNQEMSEITDLMQLTARLQAQLEDVATAVELIDLEVGTCLGTSGIAAHAANCDISAIYMAIMGSAQSKV